MGVVYPIEVSCRNFYFDPGVVFASQGFFNKLAKLTDAELSGLVLRRSQVEEYFA